MSDTLDDTNLRNHEGFRSYRSPFADWTPPDDYPYSDAVARGYEIQESAHARWSINADIFSATGSDFYFALMLREVTMDNPPLASSYKGPKLSGYTHWLEAADMFWFPLTVFLLVLTVLAGTGVI